MICKTFRIALTIVLASFALSSAARATCSNASLRGTYGFLHGGVDGNGVPNSAAVSQLTFDSTTATFTGETTSSHDGVITSFSFTGTYAVAPNCTGTGTPTGGVPFSFVVTPKGFLATHGVSSQGFTVKQGSTTCTNAGVKGSFGLQATGVFVEGAPVTGPVAFIGELKFSVNAYGDGVISGHLAGGVNGTIFTFAEEPVTGTYSVNSDCWGTATITPMGMSALTFSFVVVDRGKELLAAETDADTVVNGTLQRIDLPPCDDERLSEGVNEARDAFRENHSTVRRALELANDQAIDRIETVRM